MTKPTEDKTSAAAGDTPPATADAGDDAATEEVVADHEKEAAKWKALSRKHESQAKANAEAAKRLKELEDANKSDLDKLTERATSAEQKAAAAELKALRFEVAAEKGVPTNLMRFLTGDSREDLEAAADELMAAVKPDTGEGDTGGRPKEALRSGAAPAAEPETNDPRKLAESISRDRF